MIERIPDMPAGTVGLRASGKLSKADYLDTLEPALNEAVATGELRLVFVVSDFDGLAPAAVPEDIKTGLKTWFRDHAAWRRFALVTDVEWIAKAMRMFAWMTPGEVRIFGLEELDAAKGWVAGPGGES